MMVTNNFGSSLEMVIVSSLVTLSPKFSTWAGFKMKGSVLVPLPLTNLGLEVVNSGSGPFRIPTTTNIESPLPLAITPTSNRSNRRRSGKHRHHMNEDRVSLFSSFTVSALSLTQVSPSRFSGMLSPLSGSEPHLSSSSSDQPSPSSSLSALSPTPSSSVSNHSLPSSGKASILSLTPSPSVSSSNRSQIPSPSESTGKSYSSSGSVLHSDSS